MQGVQGQRASSQNELTQASSQKREFEARLAQLRSLYEQEVKDVRSLEERLTASRNETKKLQTDIAMIEGTHQNLQNQHRQITTTLRADQQENTSLKERIRVINAEIAQLKPLLEKLRSEARQQKGLVAINKKQLVTNEGERDKLKTEAEELTKTNEEHSRALAAASQIQSPAQVASPAPSTMSANNPFFRRQGSTSETPTSPFTLSPIPNQQSERSFENVFGPPFGTASTSHESMPATSFRRDSEARMPSTTGASNLPVRANDGSGFPTPSASLPPASNREVTQASEPPPPPESRQMSSSFLPFPAEHTESLSSSRQVSAPTSRLGEGSIGADTPTNYMDTTPTGSSAAGQTENTTGASPELNRNPTASPAASDSQATGHKDSIPGTFPGDANSQILATPTGGSTLSEQNAADPFTISKEPQRSGTAKDDFDAAFAGFGSSAKTQERQNTGGSSTEGSATGAPANFSKEFPPIAELEHDDDSDSASEQGGFDDDFTSASPGHTRKASSNQAPAVAQSATSTSNGPNDFLGARASMAQMASSRSLGTNPPTPGAQISPPAYEKAVSPGDQAHSDPQKYSGLIPKREDPTSPPPPQSVEHAPNSSRLAGGQTLFGGPQVSSQPIPPTKVPFDDFDNEFDDLEDAKEGDVDDDFANISVHDRSGIDDFNPTFDSHVQSKGIGQTTVGNSAFGGNSSGFGDFTQSPQQTTQPSTTTSNVNDNNDWDAIFAGFDGPAPATTVGAIEAAAESTKPMGNGASLNTAPKERPKIGRALTEAGEHDDPILKNLTGMGYPRTEALAALEKYDYNLERSANYLASQS
jgi:epidermal growth factor receptor substrate 15